tara:strand:- start:87 stop:338 length:252 start_codon:yes stop_codon:yes gene_type:complete
MKDEDKKYYVEIDHITTIQVSGNETYLEVRAHAIINKEGKDISTEDEYITVVVPTLELVQTFNTTWTNHAIGKLKTWINQLAK